ncbi:MAG: hypothetical protein RLY87_2668 [Chloroflexota bacterium]
MERFHPPVEHSLHWYDENNHGRMRMTGADALPLLHRLSTNHMTQLTPLTGCQTVLTTPIGRSLDLLHVVNADPEVWVFASQGQGPTVYTHLKKNIFFNDRVTLAPAAQSHRQYALYGNGATAWLASQTGLDSRTIPLWGALRWHDTLCVRIAPLGGDGWRILEPIAAAVGSLDRSIIPQLDSAHLSLWQLESGVPAFGSEVSLDYIPLESGLDHAIHSAKGCYVGQEIIARMESRGRRAKTLERITLDAAVQTPAPLTTSDGRDAGTITRVACSDVLGHIGYAYISTKIDAAETLQSGGVAVQRMQSAALPHAEGGV